MSATGIVSGLIALVVTLATWFAAPTHINSVLTVFIAGVALTVLTSVLLSAFATVYLSIRAQEAHDWDCAEVFLNAKVVRDHDGETAGDKETTDYKAEYLHNLNVAWQRNAKRVDQYERCLGDAQQYFRILVAGLVLLVAVAIFSIVTGSVAAPSVPRA